MIKILAVDDEEKILFLISESLSSEGYEVTCASGANEALETLSIGAFDLVITDLKMPGMDGLQLIERIRERDQQTIVVVMTGYATIDNAIGAIKQGADEYMSKPVNPFELRRLIKRLLEERMLRRENVKLREELEKQYSFDQFISQSKEIQGIFQKLSHIIDTDTTILLTGRSGTGKDLLARLIHFNSRRKALPFSTFSLAARPEALIEAELFGYKKGSFTGALKDTPGAVERAEGGTLFLDEIGELKPELQVKLLQFVQYKTYTPVGDSERQADVRLIAATNIDLDTMVQSGRFREDLYYRLKVVNFHIPPLCERHEDVYLLAHHYLNHFNNQYHRQVRLSPECYDLLCRMSWPGNVRELKHYLERIVLFSDEELVRMLPHDSQQTTQASGNAGLDADWPSLEELDRRYIEKVLNHAEGNKQKAATILGINPSTLWRKLKK
ncbi:MAG: sigma-54 dependent transcriptional regulator [Candidatus Wallbacteria bacterium]|nr:sigma-54 dependent transcriptional regulator [Candidatus Wallbacteria bacterium]